MFTIPHFIWLFISIVIISVTLYFVLKKRPTLSKVLTICCIVCAISEFIKVFTQVKMLPDAKGNYYPYLSRAHLPFHLCSIQIIFIIYAKFAKPSNIKNNILAFMYPTCLLGAIMALLMPSIFSDGVHDAFTSALSYQYFGYHMMLIVLGIYIPLSKEVKIEKKNYWISVGILLLLGFISIYLNSMFSTVEFEGADTYEHVVNFFFTYKNPIGLKFTELWHWYLYLIVILVLVLILFALCYLPYLKKSKTNMSREIVKEIE